MANVLINISNKAYAHIKNCGAVWVEDRAEIAKAIENGILLDGATKHSSIAPDNITNGTIVERLVDQDDCYAIIQDEQTGVVNIEVSLDWWNKQFKRKT